MAEPAGTAAAAAPERDALLATTLHRPRPRAALVARPRLLARLDEGMGRELVLVCTPAGFGKTTLLAEWARAGRRPVAWLSLDEGDNDPARFWRHVAAALDPVRPGVAGRVTDLLGSPPGSFEAPVTALVNELAELPKAAVLVLDDYHLVQSPAVHASVEFLLEHLPPSLRLVLASRADPPLPLARLRARGQLAELREADLRFTADEAAELLRSAVEADLPEAAMAALEDRTEGWATGLQLAALSLRGRGDVDAFVAGFSGSHRFVLDYLCGEVLDRQPQGLRTFLLETSVLERLSGPLCDAVTGRDDSQELLEQVERSNLFLVPLDEVRGWWRYHHLFADLLRARLRQERPGREPELHRRAAAWCDANGLADDAVRHALAAGDATWAARLIERQIDARILRWEGATLERWLAALPPELVGSRARLSLTQARLALITGRLEAIEGPLEAAERGMADAAAEPYEPSVGRAASMVANLPASIALEHAGLAHLHGDATQTLASAERALAALGEGEWMLESLARWYQAVAQWLAGRLTEAEAALASTIAAWRAASQRAPAAAALGYHCLGLIQRDQGRLEAALATYREALAVAAEPDEAAPQLAGVARVGMAAVLYQRGDLEAALECATVGVALSRRLAYTPPLIHGLATLAWVRQAKGDEGGALGAIDAAERVPVSPVVVGLINPVPAQRVRLALAQGDFEGAARWAKERGLAVEDEPSYPRQLEYLALARVLLGTGAPGRALGLLERWRALAAAQGRAGSLVEILALQALAQAGSGDEPAALASLEEALELAAPEGYLRVFVDEGPPMAGLLRRWLAGPPPDQQTAAAAVRREHFARLAAAFEQAGLPLTPAARRGAVMVPGLVEPLSPRELEVLRLLATGQPNRAIAEELVVTLDTVKRHLSHLFAKLGVANRTQAVVRARELGLLPELRFPPGSQLVPTAGSHLRVMPAARAAA
jgi:LuxR family transcriptional regulator, maltose regulon positive regulatory protein